MTHTSDSNGHRSPSPALLEILALAVRYRFWLVGIPLGTAVLTAVIVLLSPATYTTSVRFVPERTDAGLNIADAGLLGNIAASLRIGPTQVLTGSPQYYNQLLISRPILELAVWTTYTVSVNGDPRSTTLIDYLDLDPADSALSTFFALQTLRTAWISQAVDLETGVATLSVTTESRGLSHQLAARLLELVDDYNRHVRQSSAAAQRRFLETRLADAGTHLRIAEEEMEQFRRENRQFAGSPGLQIELARLQRRIDIELQVFLALRQQLEGARLQEVKDTPLLSIVDPPVPAARHDRRHGLLKMIVAAFVAWLLTGGGIFVRELWQRMPRGTHYSALMEELRNATRVFRRRRSAR